jgi:hypothetical protein
MFVESNPKVEQLFLVDSYTTNSILGEVKYFQTLKRRKEIL